ncbi:MAG: hypothetical protein RR101_01010 [Burkholderiaceae bacterium]
MKIYTVGGWVRDTLLARAGRATQPGDRDWVVVGATPQELIAQGFRPVGKDFPVFLHPRTQDEYALARTERKTAPGYKGFTFHAEPSVTLEEDLVRRDLTINAMAMDETGAITDPYGGQRDLQARVLRHVSAAFVEDPVRILRVARFAAQFPDFSIAPETLALMREIVARGEADALVAERVMQEVARGLMQARPSRLVEVLRQSGVTERLYPELTALDAAAAALDRAAAAGLPLAARYAVFLSAANSSQAAQSIAERMRAPSDAAQLARLLADLRERLATASGAKERVALLERADVFRRPERFEELLAAFEALTQRDASPWRRDSATARAVNAGAVAAANRTTPAQIPLAVRAAREAAVTALR